MSAVAMVAWFVGTWLAIGITAAWIKHRIQQRNRQARAQQQNDERIAEVNARLHRIPAAADNAEGMRLDWADECELLWAAPFDPQTGLELLRRDIRKQQREEERQ
ncbi:hypothetical protein [Streptomyces sp. NPDC002402]